jgi:two-component system chemotaxis response regulator CheY
MERSPLTILLVDDSAAMRTMLLRALAATGLPVREVVQAADGTEALCFIESFSFDLLMVDLSMPRMRGDQLLCHLRGQSATARLPVVVISSEQSDDCIRRMHASGASFVRKPFTAAAIESAILSSLDIFSDDSPADYAPGTRST